MTGDDRHRRAARRAMFDSLFIWALLLLALAGAIGLLVFVARCLFAVLNMLFG